MADNNSYKQTPRRRGPGGGMAPAEKAYAVYWQI